MNDKTFPCTARLKRWDVSEHNAFSGMQCPETVTVLTEELYWGCCCYSGHAIELPDGYPEPPEDCEYWLCRSDDLIFDVVEG